MATTYLQPLYFDDDNLRSGFVLVRLCTVSQGVEPSLHFWTYESDQLSVAVDNRQFYILRLWTFVLQQSRRHLRRPNRIADGSLPIHLLPPLVPQPSTRTFGGPVAEGDVDFDWRE